MTLIEKLGKLGGITDRDAMISACSDIPDEDLRTALVLLALTFNKNTEVNNELFRKQNAEIDRLQKKIEELKKAK